jgi:2-oxoisovalerate ferredoxin oxidoreductase beta subunit
MSSFTVLHERPQAFYDNFDRKAELQHQTHYCPGCGHGIVHKLLAEAVDSLGIQDRMVLISPVGCSVFAYYYFDVGNIQVAHGRAPAAATAVKRSRPESIVVAYQGDGDLAAIGTAEIVHAANRGEPVTIIFVNNGIYGMTGGQMAPTTPLGKKTTTSPFGRSAVTEGCPIHVCELLNSLEAPVFIERVALGNSKQIMQAGRVIRRALENQVKGLGFSFVEVLSPCPTIWKMQPVDAQTFVREEMASIFAPANYRDRTKTAQPYPAPPEPPALEAIPELLGISEPRPLGSGTQSPLQTLDVRIKVAGFGGQGVLMLGEVLAEAGLEAGYEVSWLPSYGPEMRSGTSNCHVRISSAPIDSPLVSQPSVLLALNEPSLRKFLPVMESGDLVLYNGSSVPGDCFRPDVRILARPFTEIADRIGSGKVANIVMLGALLEATGLLDEERILCTLRERKFYDLNVKALAEGRESIRKDDAYLWGGSAHPWPGCIPLPYNVMPKLLPVVLLSALPLFADGSCWLRDAASPAPSTIYALCEQGTLWFSTDAGVRWSSRDTGAKQPLRALTFLDARRAYAVGDSGLIFASEDSAKTWTARTSPVKEKLLDVAFSGDQGWSSGMNGTMIHTADAGKTWTVQKTGTTQALEALFFLDAQHGWAVGWAGTILRTVDGGANWQQIKTDASQWSLSAVCFRDAQNGWAVGFAGGILHSTDGGVTWKAVKSPVNNWLTSITFDQQNRGYIAYDDGVLTSTDGGATWTPVKADGRYFLSRLIVVNDRMFALGQTSMLRHEGNAWKKIQSLVPDASLREMTITPQAEPRP